MTILWASFTLLTLIAVAFVALPFLKKQHVTQVTHNANSQLIAIYQQRLQELADDFQDQRIEQQSYSESVIELKRRLLNELSYEKSLDSRGNNLILAVTGSAFLIVLTLVFYFATGAQNQLKSWYAAMDKLPEYGQRAVMQNGQPLTQNELQAFALGLRTKLARSGDDPVAWMLLGRVAMSLNEFDMAQQSFDKALAINPDNISVLVSYSQVLLLEGSEANMTRAAGMLSRVLKAEPSNMDAISLLALIAYERHDWVQAKAAFEVLLASMQPQDSRYDMIAKRVAEIEQKMSEQNNVDVTKEHPQLESTLNKNTLDLTDAINVTVDLAPELYDNLPENGTLFIFAKAASGPPMPLAVVKMTQYSFPIEVQLSDKNAMVEGLNLSSTKQIILTARVSKDASVMPATGELEGRSGVLERNKLTQHTLLIDRIIP